MRIFYDTDTQRDFMNRDGSLYVPDAEDIKHNLALLTDFARAKFIPVIGSVDRHYGTSEYKHREGELKRFGGPFPDHCMDNTNGQLKIFETILEYAPGRMADLTQNGYDFGMYISHDLFHNIPESTLLKIIEDDVKLGALTREDILESANSRESKTGVSPYLIDRALKIIAKVTNREVQPQGIYFEKQSYDVFTNPMAEALLKEANVKEAVVYGVATDYCVRAAVLGMQNLGIQTYVVVDAIKGITPKGEEKAIDEMMREGAKMVLTKDVLEGRI